MSHFVTCYVTYAKAKIISIFRVIFFAECIADGFKAVILKYFARDSSSHWSTVIYSRFLCCAILYCFMQTVTQKKIKELSLTINMHSC